jgi:hypothetical protein
MAPLSSFARSSSAPPAPIPPAALTAHQSDAPRPPRRRPGVLFATALLFGFGLLVPLSFGCEGPAAAPERPRALGPERVTDSLLGGAAPRQDAPVTDSSVSTPAPSTAPAPSVVAETERLVVLDTAGLLRVVTVSSSASDENAPPSPAVTTIAAGDEMVDGPGATDLVASADGRWFATFAPGEDETPGKIALFSANESALTKVWAAEVTAVEGGLVGISTASPAPLVLGFERAERASLLAIDEHGSSGRGIGAPASFRLADPGSDTGAEIDTVIEVLVSAASPPRIDFLGLQGGGLRELTNPPPNEVTTLPEAADVLLVNEPDHRLLVLRVDDRLELRDENGGVESSPPLGLAFANAAASASPLVQVAAAYGRVAILLGPEKVGGGPGVLVVRSADGSYVAHVLQGAVGPDTPPPHTLVLHESAAYVATQAGLERIAFAGAATKSQLVNEGYHPRVLAALSVATSP